MRSLLSTVAADVRQHAAEDRMKESETADLTVALLEAWSETNQTRSELARTRDELQRQRKSRMQGEAQSRESHAAELWGFSSENGG